ncbi:polymer-forming cytoskeletal protein [bacterium]|nr:polymer-forming cytoskeletal protein [bacterium]MCP5463284.1 polymer-forming cytoskeletal protein [bacterium]
MFDRDKDSGISPGFSSESETILRDDTRFKGSLAFQNKLTINGKFEGTLTSKGLLSVGKTGEVKAEVKVGSIIIEGKVWGNIDADDKIELKESAELHGDIRAKRLVICEGATFVGNSDVNPHRTEQPSTTQQSLKTEDKKKPQEVKIDSSKQDETQKDSGKSLFSTATR